MGTYCDMLAELRARGAPLIRKFGNTLMREILGLAMTSLSVRTQHHRKTGGGLLQENQYEWHISARNNTTEDEKSTLYRRHTTNSL